MAYQLELKQFQAFEKDEIWQFIRAEVQQQIHGKHLLLEDELDVVKIMRIQGEISQLKSFLTLDATLMHEMYQANLKENEDAGNEKDGRA